MFRIRTCASTSLIAACLAPTLAASAAAQTLLFGLETGQRTDEHLNGVTRSGYFGGMSLTTVLGGSAGRNGALLVPVSGEIRWSDKAYIDVNAFGDLAARIGPLTAGAGIAFSWNSVPDVPDQVSGGSTGEVIVLNPMSFGYSGSAKFSFGPQGRAFIQGRYTMFPSDYAIPYRNAEVEQVRIDNGIRAEDVTQRDSHSLRTAIGYTFRNKIVRLQYMEESWRYERIYDNRTGAYDRQSRVLALGVTFY
jgi:hypothetical protein